MLPNPPIIATAESMQQHGITLEALEHMLDRRDERMLAEFRRETDALRHDIEARMTGEQVDARIKSAVEPLSKQFTELQGTLNTFMTSMRAGLDTFVSEQGKHNAHIDGAMAVLTGQRDARLDGLHERNGQLASAIESITLRLEPIATRTNALWEDVRGVESGEGQPGIYALIRESNREQNAKIDALTNTLNTVKKTVERDHEFIDLLRSAFSWKSVRSAFGVVSKTLSGVPLGWKIVAILAGGASVVQLADPNAAAHLRDLLVSLIRNTE
jgi:hypothetical protein